MNLKRGFKDLLQLSFIVIFEIFKVNRIKGVQGILKFCYKRRNIFQYFFLQKIVYVYLISIKKNEQ